MRKFYLILNIPRLLPFIICFLLSSKKKKMEEDLQNFLNYGEKRKIGTTFYSMLNLLLYVQEYRNVFLLRQPILLKKFLAIFCSPVSSLYIVTPEQKIGKGLLVVHGFSTIINAKQVGENCTIYQQCTLGYGKTGKPTIGNNVKIYAGAIIIGDITIGNNCIIGAGAVVNKNVEDDKICVGSGFRIL